MANIVDPYQTAPIGAVCSGSTLFASILNLSVMLSNFLQQTTSAADIFKCIFFVGALKVNFFKKVFQEHYQSAKKITRVRYVSPDLGPNCLQGLSADDTSRR